MQRADEQVAPDLSRRARTLALLDRGILDAYSRRTIDALGRVLPVRIALPPFEQLLTLNVDKEAQKDALVIRACAQGLAAGSASFPGEARRLLEETKSIDRAFLGRASAFPVGIVIRYENIAPARLQRIEQLLAVTRRILDAWNTVRTLRLALRDAYTRPEFERELNLLLDLYAQETSALSNSVRLPAILTPLRARLAAGLYRAMQDAGARLTGEVSRIVYSKTLR